MTQRTKTLTTLTAEPFLLNSLYWIPRVFEDWASNKTADQISIAAAGVRFFAVHVYEGKVKWEPCNFISDRSWTRHELRLLSQALARLEENGLVEVEWRNEHRPHGVKLTPKGEERWEEIFEAGAIP